MQTLTITRPDDWHLHVRDGAILASVVKYSARCFARAIIMPNLSPPVMTVAMAAAYRERILAAVPPGVRFEPLMTLYLNDALEVAEIAKAKQSGVVYALKLFPRGIAYAAQSGLSSIEKGYPVLEAMQEHDVPLCVHGEVTDKDVDFFDREKVFIDRSLRKIVERFPNLRVIFEHISSEEAVQFVTEARPTVGATITPTHLLHNRNALFDGGIHPHMHLIPILKREKHRVALVKAATSGNPKFFLGTDSAPHAQHTKETACGCAGVFNAHAAIELYAEVFERAEALDRLEGFASFHGADFYRLPRNRDTVTLRKEPWQVPDHIPLGPTERQIPMRAAETVEWRIAGAQQ